MLYCQWHVFLREVEHIEDDVLCTAVLSVMNGVHHLYDGLALMYDLLFTILSDNGQLTLYQYAVVHHGMVVPAQLFSCREHVLHCHQLGASL